MMNRITLIIFLLFVICTFSCRQNRNTNKKELNNPNQALKGSEEHSTLNEMLDSIKTVDFDIEVEEKKVFDVFAFGMSEKNVLSLKQEYYSNGYLDTGDNSYKFDFKFNQNKNLFKVILFCKHHFYNSPRGSIQFMPLTNLFEILIQKYGRPSFINEDSFPYITVEDLYDIDFQQSLEIVRWDIGKKTISLNIRRPGSRMDYYNVECEITDKEMVLKMEECEALKKSYKNKRIVYRE